MSALAARRAAANTDQLPLRFLMGAYAGRQLLNPNEAAKCLNRSVDFVYAMIDEGKLEAHAPHGREKQRYQITARSVALLLAETALYDGADFVDRVYEVLDRLTAEQLGQVITHATHRRARL